jgi:hypothetical protein
MSEKIKIFNFDWIHYHIKSIIEIIISQSKGMLTNIFNPICFAYNMFCKMKVYFTIYNLNKWNLESKNNKIYIYIYVITPNYVQDDNSLY